MFESTGQLPTGTRRIVTALLDQTIFKVNKLHAPEGDEEISSGQLRPCGLVDTT